MQVLQQPDARTAVHLRHVETHPRDALLTELHKPIAYLVQIEELAALLIHAFAPFHTGLLLQLVVIA